MQRTWIINTKVRSATFICRAVQNIFPHDEILTADSIQQIQTYIHASQLKLCIIVGGDGTWSKALMSCSTQQILGYFPGGTLNQTIFELNQSSQLMDWKTYTVHKIHLGQIISRQEISSFFMMLGVGVEADAVEIIRPRLKQRLGKTAYVIALLERLIRPVRKTITLQVDEKSWQTSQLIILNGKHYAGNYALTDKSDIFQAEYVILIWKHAGRFNWLCGMLARMFNCKISHLWIEEIKTDTDNIVINGQAQVQIDGDPAADLPLIVSRPVIRQVAIS